MLERASTLITSQLPVKAWHEAIGDPTLADSICDRLIHTAQVIELHGPSMREVRAKAQRGGASGDPTGRPAGVAGLTGPPRRHGRATFSGSAAEVAERAEVGPSRRSRATWAAISRDEKVLGGAAWLLLTAGG